MPVVALRNIYVHICCICLNVYVYMIYIIYMLTLYTILLHKRALVAILPKYRKMGKKLKSRTDKQDWLGKK